MNDKEKAKAYDEIIERAKTMLSAGEVMYGKENNASQLITDLIPELRESEDERIYNEIMEFFKMNEKRCIVDNSYTRWIAWLEKQEQKPVEDRGAVEPTPKQNYSGLTDFERAIHRGFLCAGVENVPVTIIKETAQDCLAQQKAEWNIEDKACLDTILCAVQGKFVTDAALEQAISWLKSLRPSWKPSEEQMKVLKDAIIYVESSGSNFKGSGSHLESLYEQLKKL